MRFEKKDKNNYNENELDKFLKQLFSYTFIFSIMAIGGEFIMIFIHNDFRVGFFILLMGMGVISTKSYKARKVFKNFKVTTK